VTRQDLGHFAIDADDRHVQRAAAQIVDHDGSAAAGIQPIGKAGGRRLVDHADDFQSGQLTGFPRGVPLRVGKIGRDGDDRLLDRFPKPKLRPSGQLAQDQGGDFLRCEGASPQRHRLVAAHQPFDAFHRAVGIQQHLVARRLADQQFARGGESDATGQHQTRPIADHLRLAINERRDFGIGRSQVDSNYRIGSFCHDFILQLVLC
jgi:hypothetical protein